MKNIKIILISIVIMFCLTGCTSSIAEESRFIKINSEETFDIYYDKKTKVEYAVSNGYYNFGTVTLLVDSEGKPLLYEGE